MSGEDRCGYHPEIGVPGELVVAVVGTYYAVVLVLAAWSARGERVQEFQE